LPIDAEGFRTRIACVALLRIHHHLQIRIEIFGGRPQQRDAAGVDLIVRPRPAGGRAGICHRGIDDVANRHRYVIEPAIHFTATERNASFQRLTQRTRHRALDEALLSLELIAGRHIGFEFVSGIRGGQRDHARGRILSEEQSLRTLQHLNLLEIENG
jgi:hypothetical protein